MKIKAKSPERVAFVKENEIREFINLNPGQDISFEQVRQTVNEDHYGLPDGHIHQIVIDMGLKVEGD